MQVYTGVGDGYSFIRKRALGARMALAGLSSVIDAVAEWDNRDRATVEQFVLLLSQAGYLRAAMAGLSTTAIEACEAATLLIALSSSDTPEAAADAVKVFSGLEWSPANDCADHPLAKLLAHKRFGKALTTLLLNIPTLVSEIDSDQSSNLWSEASFLSVTLERPIHTASIEIRGRPQGDRRTFCGVWGGRRLEQSGSTEELRRSQTTVFWPALVCLSRLIESDGTNNGEAHST